MKSVVSMPQQPAEEANENLKAAGLNDRLFKAYPRLFSGVASKSHPDRRKFGTAKIKLKRNMKIFLSPGISTPRRARGCDEEALRGIS